MWKIPLFDLDYDEREEGAVLAVLRDKWLTQGPRTAEFEDSFARRLGGGVQCVAVSSCTAALHLALLAANIGPGDEVIVPGLTFVADLNVVSLVGATPVLADITSLDDWNLSPEDVARRITPRTRAVIAVHYAGYPCDMEALKEICGSRGIFIIEDVAHAVGASSDGRECGMLGDMGCFSFFSNKNLSVGEGGMFITADAALAERVRLLRCHGMTSLTVDRHAGRDISYDVREPGLNYRLDEMRAALGLVQLEKLDQNNARRREIARAYRERLSDSELLVPFRSRPAGETNSAHIFPVLLPEGVSRPGFMAAMREAGVQTSIHYPGFETFEAYAYLAPGETTRAVTRRVVTLPLYPTMAEDDVETVVRAAESALENAREKA